MSQKIEVTELTHLFKVIELSVKDTNMPERQKSKWIRNLQKFAKAAGHDIGKTGKTELTS